MPRQSISIQELLELSWSASECCENEVVFRDENPSPETTKAALDHIESDPDLRERAKGLVPVAR